MHTLQKIQILFDVLFTFSLLLLLLEQTFTFFAKFDFSYLKPHDLILIPGVQLINGHSFIHSFITNCSC